MDLNNPAHPGHSNYLIPTGGKRAEQVFYHDTPLFESTITELIDHLEGHHMERSGLLDEDQNIVLIPNIHSDPHNNFYWDNDAAIEALDSIYEKGHHVLGIWHTHPNGYPWPTPRDIAGWPDLRLNWRYFLVTRGEVTEWKLVQDD